MVLASAFLMGFIAHFRRSPALVGDWSVSGSVVMAVIMILSLSGDALGVEELEPPAPARIHKIKVVGNDHLRTREILAHIRTDKPSWIPWREKPALDERGLDADMDLIRTFYRRYGFYEVEASYTLDWNRAKTKVKVLIQVVEGESV